MYDNSASLRMSGLIDRFDLHAVAERVPTVSPGQMAASLGAPAGALLDIGSDPFAAAEYFSDMDEAWPDRASRARDALAKKPKDWQSDAKWAAGVKTTLSRLGVDTSARLLRHAYALAAMNLHVLLAMPLQDVPPLAEFKAMCR
jgi:hypothetical protein